MLKSYIAIFLGGGIGSILRYAVQIFLHERISVYNFPWATFTVNIAGSFLIGLFYTLSSRFNLQDDIRLLLTAGLCGGFTTFSTFSNDIVTLIRQGAIVTGLFYAIISVAFGLVACFIGANILHTR